MEEECQSITPSHEVQTYYPNLQLKILLGNKLCQHVWGIFVYVNLLQLSYIFFNHIPQLLEHPFVFQWFSSFRKLYQLIKGTSAMQCILGLSKLSCNNCIKGAINGISGCSDRKQWGRVVKPSCNIKFKLYRFYNFTATNAPPPPPPITPSPSLPTNVSTPPPPSNTMSTKGTYIS